jgi:membrane protein implicated in regulation of membrane protease activity
MTRSDKIIIAAALLPVCFYLALMVALLILQPFDIPGGVMPAIGAVVTVASIAFANFLRRRRDRRP